MKYRKKPVVIEAYQTDKELDIETLEGTMHASVGDYIITGVRGEQYPCKPDIFEQTYEPVDTPTEGGFSGGVSDEITKACEQYIEREKAAEKIVVEEDFIRRRRKLEELKHELEELKRMTEDG